MEKIIVEKDQAGIRIDKFLAKEFFLYTRGEIIRSVRAGQILIGGKKIKPSYLLEEEDIIEILIPREKELFALEANKDVALDIIYEDENILVLNKQAGIQVHPDEHEKKYTLVNGLIARYPEIVSVHDQSREANLRPGIVHRLDKDTTGVMVVAKNMESFNELKMKFQNREATKEYLAISEGRIEKKEDVIDKPIARAADYKRQTIASNRTKTAVRSAVTLYKVLAEGDGCCLVRVTPKTGRMHQIRLHLASIGLPIIGDRIYGKKDDKFIADRQLLHAYRLSFDIFGKKNTFKAPIPKDLGNFLDKFGIEKKGI